MCVCVFACSKERPQHARACAFACVHVRCVWSCNRHGTLWRAWKQPVTWCVFVCARACCACQKIQAKVTYSPEVQAKVTYSPVVHTKVTYTPAVHTTVTYEPVVQAKVTNVPKVLTNIMRKGQGPHQQPCCAGPGQTDTGHNRTLGAVRAAVRTWRRAWHVGRAPPARG